VPVWLDVASGEAEYVTLEGEPDRDYGLVFGPDQIDRWLAARDEAVRRRVVNEPRRRRRRV
jgi:lipocalin